MGTGSGGLVLVTGANGYIASRLIPRLLDAGRSVRVAAREPALLKGRPWAQKVEVVAADTRRADSLAAAMRGVDTAYYLIHSMASGRGYIEIERESARRFAAATGRAGVRHIIYLGGLADPRAKNLAPHMRSRIETGEILRQGSAAVTEFRAGVIVGAGSISFEMIRFLAEFFPIMIGPRWLRNKSQPIAVDNVIDYLVTALQDPGRRGGIYEVGGPDQMSYADTMLGYARARGLKRRLFTLPGIPIWLMACAVDRLTPVPYSIATALVGGLQSDSVVLHEAARRRFPGVNPIAYGEALGSALADLHPERLEPVWEGIPKAVVRIKHEGFFIDHRRLEIKATQQRAFEVVTSMGGAKGWPYANWLWRLRGWLDRRLSRKGEPKRSSQRIAGAARGVAAGGLGRLQPGDRIDYYTVEAVEPGCRLRLYSNLRAPGEGWMEWQVEATSADVSMLQQTAFFAPRGLAGLIYWLTLGPVHRLVFRGLIRSIARRSEGK